MSEEQCPHCGDDLDLEHMTADGDHEFDCENCGKTLNVLVEIEYVRTVSCLDSEHNFVESSSVKSLHKGAVVISCTHCKELRIVERTSFEADKAV